LLKKFEIKNFKNQKGGQAIGFGQIEGGRTTPFGHPLNFIFFFIFFFKNEVVAKLNHPQKDRGRFGHPKNGLSHTPLY